MKYFTVEFRRLYNSLYARKDVVDKTRKFSEDVELLLQQNNDFLSFYESINFDGDAKKKLDVFSFPVIKENLEKISSNVSCLFSSLDIAFNKLCPLLEKLKDKDLVLDNKNHELTLLYKHKDDILFLFRTAERYDEFGKETSYYLTQKDKYDRVVLDIVNLEKDIKLLEKELDYLSYCCKNEIKVINQNSRMFKNIEIGNDSLL